MPMQKPNKHYSGGGGCAPSNPAAMGGHPHVYVLVQGVHRKNVDFFPKVCSRTYLVIFTHLDLFLRELSFFK